MKGNWQNLQKKYNQNATLKYITIMKETIRNIKWNSVQHCLAQKNLSLLERVEGTQRRYSTETVSPQHRASGWGMELASE